MTRAGTAVALVIVVGLLAGCSAGGGGASLATTAAPAGATTPVAATAAPAPTAATGTVAALPILSATWDLGRFTLADGAVSEDWGVVAAPTTAGPHPVAVLIHGNHPTCPTDTGGLTWPCPPGTEVANHAGLAYLVEALARRGFVALAPGVNVQYTLGSGEPASAVRSAAIVDRALTSLAQGRLGVEAGAADVTRLVLVGHSTGGQDASLMAAGKAGFTRPVDGVVMLQPALNDAAALPLVDVPVVVVLSECDGDTGLGGGDYVARALLASRRSPVALVVIGGANHNHTNTGRRAEGVPVNAPACDPERRLTATAQQEVLASIVPEFAHAVAADGQAAGWAGAVFRGATPPPGMTVAVVDAGEPVAPVPGPGPQAPAMLTANGMTLTWCPPEYVVPAVRPGSEPCHRPELPMLVGYPRSIAASWSAAGASLAVPVTVPRGGTVRLRVIPDIADARLTSPLVLELTAGTASRRVAIELPETRTEWADPFMLTFGLAMWTTVDLPVPDGAQEVALRVVAPPAGSIQVVSLGPVS